MSLTRSIVASQARVVALRDNLFDLLDDTNVSSTQELVDDLSTALAQEQATLNALMAEERRVIWSEAAP